MGELGKKLMSYGDEVVGGLLGMATSKWQDKRQLKQSKKLQDQNIAGQKQIGEFNRLQAMKMWEDTGYGAQKKQMKEAGLNAGLMYGGTGAGGTTQGGSAGSVDGGQIASGEVQAGMGLGLQKSMQEAQIRNLNSSSNKMDVEAGKTGGIDTKVAGASLDKLIAEAKTEAEKTKLISIQRRNEEVKLKIGSATSEAEIERITQESLRGVAQTQRELIAMGIEQSTAGEIVKQSALRTTGMTLENALSRVKIEKGEVEIEKINTEMWKILSDSRIDWENLDVKQREVILKERMTGFVTSSSQETNQVISVIDGIMDLILKPAKVISGFIPGGSGESGDGGNDYKITF